MQALFINAVFVTTYTEMLSFQQQQQNVGSLYSTLFSYTVKYVRSNT